MELLTSCPACGNNSYEPFMVCTDFTVSKEKFTLVKCNNCTLIFTNPRPTINDIGKYYQSQDYISHSNVSKGIMPFLYQQARKITLPAKVKLINKTTGLNQGKLLDIGCGTGHFLAHAKKVGWEVTGIEPSEDARAQALNLNQINAKNPDELVNLPTAAFDVITMWHVLEHVHALSDQMMQLNRLLKPGGFAIIAVPNPSSADAQWYKEHWAGYDVPRHLYHFSPQVIRSLFSKHGFLHKSTHQMIFDPFYVCLLSERIKFNKPNYVKAFSNGLKSLLHAKNNADTCTSQVYVFKKN